ncbi:uncharacterized protein PHACADRAFT_252409 [Phanerochaete carnosa HHB-10118-sp]|uniref:Metal homeostatis protein bsd2 n=1 Tax=Phanerochaete carnosa (strain HHB-10118-sp) TaxID=650164 RepID=K5WFZ2_PHACS|nr:uncharacterized protein PHACADRAFT_252409 [Phanerochaete carnosa HHB-10118-sp]EKM58235.1 hypothetical protein PHACADRAFT_252409 [Phanerochaete carnosa HHB-10118-sp]
MPSAQYAPLPNPRSVPDAEREMHEAFQLDDDEEEDDHQSESTPLVQSTMPRSLERGLLPLSVATPAAYDFERDYDYDLPPPGSPPDPSVAYQNAIGNSNGVLPSSPIRPSFSRPSFFKRMAGALLPQHYQRLPIDAASQRAVGGGMDNDGVFANVMAKPSRAVQVRNDDGSIYMVPEEAQNQAPPSYNEAQADAVPPYWETTITSSLDPNADMIVDDLPTGAWYLFFANAFISYFFQFIGFLFTYLLHTTHAAKYGSRVGLGLTLIQFGFQSRRRAAEELATEVTPAPAWANVTVASDAHASFSSVAYQNGTVVEVPLDADITSRDWVAFLLMTLGWFLLLSSFAGYFRVKRWERSIRSSAPPPTTQPDSAANTHHPLLGWLNVGADDLHTEDQGEPHMMNESEARLARDLRTAGLI